MCSGVNGLHSDRLAKPQTSVTTVLSHHGWAQRPHPDSNPLAASASTQESLVDAQPCSQLTAGILGGTSFAPRHPGPLHPLSRNLFSGLCSNSPNAMGAIKTVLEKSITKKKENLITPTCLGTEGRWQHEPQHAQSGQEGCFTDCIPGIQGGPEPLTSM